MVELRGIEGPAHRPRTSAVHRRVSSVLLALIATPAVSGGATRDRTADLLNANQALSQLSYSPSNSVSAVITNASRYKHVSIEAQ